MKRQLATLSASGMTDAEIRQNICDSKIDVELVNYLGSNEFKSAENILSIEEANSKSNKKRKQS
jgi:hypothetical protein